jgi:spectinomycin phosphotransferase
MLAALHRADPAAVRLPRDTVGLAPPERDLWMVASESGDELRRYTELTGRPVDTTALARYRLRWALDGISAYLRQLRARHRCTVGTEHAWRSLERTIANLPQ